MLQTIQNILIKYAILISSFVAVVNILFSLWNTWWQEKKKNMYIHQLQVEFVKVELRTKQISNIYPELLLRFNRAKSTICQLCRKKMNKENTATEQMAHAKILLQDALIFIEQHLLFISSAVEKSADNLTASLNEYEEILKNKSVNEIKSYKNKIQDLFTKLQDQMKSELGCR